MTGLRVNEALGLAEEEVDPQRSPADDQAKNRRSRLVPLSASTAERMGAYRAERNHILGHGRVAFFLLEA